MMVPEMIHPRTHYTVTVDEYHRSEIGFYYRQLKEQIKRYLKFRWRELKWERPKKVDKAFMEKLAYWGKNKALTVITDDTVEAFKSMADGKHYTSKKKYRQEIHARGYDEVGNDKQEHRVSDKYWADKARDKDIKQDIAETIYAR